VTRFFVSGTGTGVGKTWVTRGLARALRRRGRSVVALKPLETGCDPLAVDARALAVACGRPELAALPGLYRARLPLAPWAASLEGEPPPELRPLAAAVDACARAAEIALIEGAGGVRVPIDAELEALDLVPRLGARLVLVARDQLGVLSHTLTAYECAVARGIDIAVVVLTCGGDDLSSRTNARILEAKLSCPVVCFPRAADDDDALADAAEPVLRALGLG
jgi:dethiobiotin synthetase